MKVAKRVIIKQRYTAQKIGGYLNEMTLEYDADRWCVLDGDYVVSECDVQADARKIVSALNMVDKIAKTVNGWEK